jgi:hypothetical protein
MLISGSRPPIPLPDPAEWRVSAVCEDDTVASRFKNPEFRDWSIAQCDACSFATKCLAQTIIELRNTSTSDILEYDVRAGFPVERLVRAGR